MSIEEKKDCEPQLNSYTAFFGNIDDSKWMKTIYLLKGWKCVSFIYVSLPLYTQILCNQTPEIDDTENLRFKIVDSLLCV